MSPFMLFFAVFCAGLGTLCAGSDDIVGEVWIISSDLTAERFDVFENSTLLLSLKSGTSHGDQRIHDSCPASQRSCDQTVLLSNSGESSAIERAFPSLEVVIIVSFRTSRIEVQNIPLPNCNIICAVPIVPYQLYFLCDEPVPSGQLHLELVYYDEGGWVRVPRPPYPRPLPPGGTLFLFNDIITSALELYYAYSESSTLYFQGVDGSGYDLHHPIPPWCDTVARLTPIGDQELLLECSTSVEPDMITGVYRFDFNTKEFFLVFSGPKYEVCPLRFSSNNSAMAVCAADEVRVLDLRAGGAVVTVKVTDAAVFDCVFTADELVYVNRNGIFVVNFNLSLNNTGGVVVPHRIDQSERFVCTHVGCPLLSNPVPNIIVSTSNNSIALISISPPMFLNNAPLSHTPARIVATFNASRKLTLPTTAPPPTNQPKSIVRVVVPAVLAVVVVILVLVGIGVVIMGVVSKQPRIYQHVEVAAPTDNDGGPAPPADDPRPTGDPTPPTTPEPQTITAREDDPLVSAVQNPDNAAKTKGQMVT